MRTTFLATSLAAAVSSAWAAILYAGVNESGGEFGVFGTKGQGLPGTFGVDYAFINTSTVDIYVDQEKINLFRVAFLLERMCPLATGLGSTFDATYFGHFQDAINHITVTKGAYAILDPHNYMRYNDPSSQPNSGSVIGNTSDPTAATTEQFQEFWQELASRFVDNPNVIFGIMNEPHDMPTQLILQNDQAAIDGIRAAGAQQLIIAPGNGFTGGHDWLQTPDAEGDAPSGDFLFMIQDPLNNTAMDVHEYLDTDFSGSHLDCVSPADEFLADLTGWLHEHNLKAMITEFGASNSSDCISLAAGMVDYLANNSDVYIGWSMWAAGPLWGTSAPCCSDGTLLGSLEPNVPAGGGSPPMFETVWQTTIEPRLPTTLKKSGMSSLS